MPTVDCNSCVVARDHPAAGEDDYQLPRVLKAEHAPLPTIVAYSPAEVPMGEGCLFELKGITYLLVIDYFSRYIEVQSLTSTTSASII